MKRLKSLALGILAAACARNAALAFDDTPTAEDRAALSSCLDEAASHDPNGDRNSCIDAIAGPCLADPQQMTTVGQIECVARETALWDEMLNDIYGRLRAELDEEAFNAVREAQRKWIAFRDADCAVPRAILREGTIIGPIEAACFMEITARRANALHRLLDASWE